MFSSPPHPPSPVPAEMGPIISLLLWKARSLLSGALGSLSNTAESQSSCKVSHRHFGEMACSFVLTLKNKMQREKTGNTGFVVVTTSYAKYHSTCLSWASCCVIDSTCLVLPWVPSIGDRPAGSVWACLSRWVLVCFFIFSIFTVGEMARRLTSSPFCPSVSHSIDVTSEQWSCHSGLSLWHQSASLRGEKMYYWINNVGITG